MYRMVMIKKDCLLAEMGVYRGRKKRDYTRLFAPQLYR
jgi:hypothetical protein